MCKTMTKAERTVNLIAVVLPFVAFLAAIILLWNSYVGVATSSHSASCTSSPASA